MRKLKNQFIKLKIKPKPDYPDSITYIQNPYYRGALISYRKILNKAGISEDIFKYVNKIERFGVLDIPTVFERWCLIRIIDELINSFHFTTEDNWISNLVIALTNTNEKNNYFKLLLFNQPLELKAEFFYQRKIVVRDNKERTPDYVLEISDINNNNLNSIVIDAKFRNFINDDSKNSIQECLRELLFTKDYTQNGKNSLFIIHPSEVALGFTDSLQKWKEHTYYGEDMLFDWQEEKPNHQVGAVLLRPSNKLNLHRFLGLLLQYKFNKTLCVKCGSCNIEKNLKRTQGGHEKYWCICRDCNHFFVETICQECHNKIYKNGSFWTYHATSQLSLYNIKCPKCGSFYIPRS